LGLLTDGNFGVSLWAGNTMLASTASAPDQLLTLVPLGGTEYTLSLEYDAVEPSLGPVTVKLFADPEQLIGVSLLPTVTFQNARLDATAINPVSGSIVAVDSTPQTATVAEAFDDPLAVRVTDVDGDPVPGATVTFTAPDTGASATLSDETVETDSQGFASVDATANTIAGSYTIVATVEGVDTPATFSMTNTAGAPASTVAASGELQSAVLGAPFPQPLVVEVVDAYGNPVEGVNVAFDAPDDGASAVLSSDVVATDANGLASVEATANDVAGTYDVTATVEGVDPPATFALENRATDDGTTIDGGGGDDQSADIDGTFACAIVVHVNDANGAPAVGYAVDFAAPDSGASATLSNGVVSGTSVQALTDANGAAVVSATANGVPGSYTVSAQLSGAPGSVEFGLENVEGLIFSNGFDTPCAAPTM
ncbi:MAG TPA: Ig-like domain-containing protein, partial [Polyangiaceae bacterium]